MNKKSKLKDFLKNSDDAKLNGCVINWCGTFHNILFFLKFLKV